MNSMKHLPELNVGFFTYSCMYRFRIIKVDPVNSFFIWAKGFVLNYCLLTK